MKAQGRSGSKEADLSWTLEDNARANAGILSHGRRTMEDVSGIREVCRGALDIHRNEEPDTRPAPGRSHRDAVPSLTTTWFLARRQRGAESRVLASLASNRSANRSTTRSTPVRASLEPVRVRPAQV